MPQFMSTFTRASLSDQQLEQIVQEYNTIKSSMLKSFDSKFLDITKRYTTDQLLQINRAYYKKYKESISDFISRQMKDSDTLDLTNKVLAPRHLAWAMSIKTALSDLRTNTDLLITTVLLMEPVDIRNTKLAYRIQYDSSLEADLVQVCPGQTFWQALLIRWMTRDSPGVVNPRFNPAKDALKLLEATRGVGTDEAKYIEIFTTTTNDEFLKLLTEYPRLSENTTHADFYKDLSGEFEDLDLYAAQLVINKQYGMEKAIGFFFENCFNDDTTIIKNAKFADKPMLNFLTSCFRDSVNLEKASPGAKALIIEKCLKPYETALIGYWFQVIQD